jgi:hypothetical protein
MVLHDRLVPEVHKAFQFQATRIERYLVACYEAQTGGHFRPHRDNTTKGTAHRRFAVSIVLNAGEFTGGHLAFPEFGRMLYAPPLTGAAPAMPEARGRDARAGREGGDG